MNNSDIVQWRMHNLGLSKARFETPEDVVHWLGAVQSQDYAPAKWSVAQRTNTPGDAAMDQAFADGTILRTHVLRPTWHFVLPADIRWMLELTAPRVQALSAYYYRERGLDDTALNRCNAVLVRALQGGHRRTRKELAAALESAGIATSDFRLGSILMNAELEGIHNHAVILDGQVAGHWKRRTNKDTVIVEVALYTPFDDAQIQALQAAAERYGVFLGLTATVVTTGM